MKKIINSLFILLSSLTVFGQVETDKVKNTTIGKTSVLAIPTSTMMLDNFQINYYLLGGASDQAGSGVSTVSVGVRATLLNIDEPLIQEITDEAYAYFCEKWKARGVTVVVPEKSQLEASKQYSKAAAKGEGKIVSGGTERISDKDTDLFNSWPTGTNIAFSGTKIVPKPGNQAHLPSDFKGNYFWTSFGSTINFIDFKTAKIGSTASVNGEAQLSGQPTSLGVSVWEKTKYGVYGAYQMANGSKEFFDDMKKDTRNILNTKFSFWNYEANPKKYKEGVLEILKKSMDEMFADYDEVVAKEKG